jgi:ubiquitin-protein ligase E3 D
MRARSHNMSPPAPALMYAELLSNINRISVLAALQTPSTRETKATLSENGRQIQLVHDGTTTILALPALASSITNLKQPPLGSQEISWSIGLRSLLTTYSKPKPSDTPSTPWQASQLPEKAQISCRNCGNILVAAGTVETWKDLPSENWAEMMDFWHCHKPDIHKQDTAKSQSNNRLEERGYGATQRFTAQNGVGFVDLTYFLLSKGNCQGIKVRVIYS